MTSVPRNKTTDKAPATHTRRIPIDPEVARDAGLEAAVFLAQLIYWSTRKHRDPDGWIYKTHVEWEEETSLTEQQQRTARKRLKEKMGEAFEERYANRFPRRLEFRIDLCAVRGNQRTGEAPCPLAATPLSVGSNEQSVASNEQAGGLSAESHEGSEAIRPPIEYSENTTKKTLSCEGSPSEPPGEERDLLQSQGEEGGDQVPGERIAIPKSPSPTSSLPANPNAATLPETNQRGAPPRSADPPTEKRTSAWDLVHAWNAVVPEHLREPSPTEKLRALCRQPLHEHPELEWWHETFGHVPRSAWLRGSSPKAGWNGAALGWVIAHADKVRAGQWDDKAPPGPPPLSPAALVDAMVRHGWPHDMAEAWVSEHRAYVVSNGGYRGMLPMPPIVVPSQE